MEIGGQQLVPASQAETWKALNDTEILKQCIPGCESMMMQDRQPRDVDELLAGARLDVSRIDPYGDTAFLDDLLYRHMQAGAMAAIRVNSLTSGISVLGRRSECARAKATG